MKMRATVLLLPLLLAACTEGLVITPGFGDSPGFGDAVHANLDAAIPNPNPVYDGTVNTNPERAALIHKRYREGNTLPPIPVGTTGG